MQEVIDARHLKVWDCLCSQDHVTKQILVAVSVSILFLAFSLMKKAVEPKSSLKKKRTLKKAPAC